MDKETAKAILISNLKGSRKKRLPLTTISRAVRLLVNDNEYGSSRSVAKEFDITRQVIESFYRILDHPKEIQKLIKDGKILLDASTKLHSIKNIERRVEVANVIAGMIAFDSRDIIDYCKRKPNLSAEECKNIVLESKPVNIITHAVVAPLNECLFKQFKKIANNKNMNLHEAALAAIKKWIIEEENR